MAISGSKGHTISSRGIKTLRDVVTYVNGLRGEAKRNPIPQKFEESVAFRAVVVGIDIATWGAGRKKLSVQALIEHPFIYGGPIIFADGWIDSPIVCGQEVLCLRTTQVIGDPEDQPSFVAMPMMAVDQSNLDEPDPTCTTRVVTPCLPLLAQAPCVPAPEI